ncbi:MAG: RNA-splicing ligase RtcB, partial [Chloroflexi bacterium]
MIRKQDFRKINDYLWEIPQTFRKDMRVPARLYATERMLEATLGDRSVEQLINTATLPGVLKFALAMPDIHQGYGFPIGGVIATKLPEGVISPGGVGYDINCLAGETQILHDFGYTLSIADMERSWPNDRLRCQHLEEGREDTTPIVRYLKQRPRRPVYRLVTEGGDEVIATADHPFWTPNGMVALEHLSPGDRVARYPFLGVPYEPPSDSVLVDTSRIERILTKYGGERGGNRQAQVIAHLERRNLLPLRFDSPALPHLLKLLGYLFGDGTVHFSASSGKGVAWFYGKREDLMEIQAVIAAVGFTPSPIYTRKRGHQIQTMYGEYTFEREEMAIKVSSSAFAALLAALGMPIGAKATQDYRLPGWLFDAPRWQQRLFLAAFFGAELSTPRPFTERNHNFPPPVLSLNKREGFVESGRQFLQDISRLLDGFGVETKAITRRAEQVNQDGRRSYRWRLVLSSRPESLINLWGRIGFEFNRRQQRLAGLAVEYLKRKQQRVGRRNQVAQQAVAMQAAGYAPATIYAELAGDDVNRRFLERS